MLAGLHIPSFAGAAHRASAFVSAPASVREAEAELQQTCTCAQGYVIRYHAGGVQDSRVLQVHDYSQLAVGSCEIHGSVTAAARAPTRGGAIVCVMSSHHAVAFGVGFACRSASQVHPGGLNNQT